LPHLFSLLALALAVSLDGFGAGAMYGLRKIRIPIVSILIIAGMSGLVIFGSMQIGVYLSAFFSPEWAKMMGAVILIAIGLWAVYQMLTQKDSEQGADTRAGDHRDDLEPDKEEPTSSWNTVLSIELKRLGLVIQILRTPSMADIDKSGTISASEAALLGLALSLDAFGAGIGAAFIGFHPVLTSGVIAAACGSFIYLGLRVGFLYSNLAWVRRLSALPGCILILMGIFKLL